MKLILMRHGSIRLPEEEVCYIGQTDRSMTPKGREEADRCLQKIHMQVKKIDEVWCSDLKRCVETAVCAKERLGVPYRTDPRLREIKLGEWEGKSFQQIRVEHPGQYRDRGEHLGTYCTPGGENFRQAMIRAVQFTEERVQCLQEESVILFITHAGVIRALCCCRDHRHPDEVLRYRIGYGEYVVWEETKADLLLKLRDQSYY